jgi:hypothetical protein
MARQVHFTPTRKSPSESRFPCRPFSRSIVLAVFLLTLIAASGKSIKMVTSWFNPKYEGQKFHKILVIGVAQDLKVRADFEDEMAAQIARPGIQTIPGNQILLRPDPKAKLDLDYLRAQIRGNQIDAVVVSRLLRVDKKVTSIPSSTYVAPFPYYYSFYGYLGAVYPVVYDPGYTREDTTVSVETNVYATRGGWPRLLILQALPKQWVPHPSPAFREGWEPQLLARWDLALTPTPETPGPESSGILSGWKTGVGPRPVCSPATARTN